MPLSASSPLLFHVLQNLSLIALSIFLAPLCTIITICSSLASPYTHVGSQLQRSRNRRDSPSSTFQPRRVLITGVGMSKGLAIARAFYCEGHHVIGADFEPHGIPVCGRFSTALRKFYRLNTLVSGLHGSSSYMDQLVNIIITEKIELWISCSGVASAIDDAEAAEAVEKQTSCKAVQFGAELTTILHEKNSFIQQARSFGLNTPETHFITSVDDAMTHLYGEKADLKKGRMIMKSVGLDDSIRADMTTLPLPSVEDTRKHLARLKPSVSRPFVLQQYIRGPEFCTHSVVVRGRVVAFTACPSAELLMHYQALSPTAALSEAMQKYTEVYAEKMSHDTGHFSIDFILGDEDSGVGLMDRLHPIECNPRAHTAVVLFNNESESMVNAYLSVFKEGAAFEADQRSVCTPSSTTGYYWIGHDMVTCVILPLLSVLSLRGDLSSMLQKWREFVKHVKYWKEGTYEIWDPWPFWALYCVFWPSMFIWATLTRSRWSRCNVSTTKVFRC